MQVLCLGLSRMGTESLRRALQILDYKPYHGFDEMHGGTPIRQAWTHLGRRKFGLSADATPVTAADLDAIIGDCDAVTDQPCACFALELIEGHPGAKVVLNYRDEDAWFESVRNTFVKFMASFEVRVLSYFDTFLYWRAQSFVYYEEGFFRGSVERHGRRVHKEHKAMVKGLVEKERLLEWRVEDGWEPLCKFLGKKVPVGIEFPSGNTPEDLRRASVEAARQGTKRAYLKVGALVLGLSVGLALWIKRT